MCACLTLILKTASPRRGAPVCPLNPHGDWPGSVPLGADLLGVCTPLPLWPPQFLLLPPAAASTFAAKLWLSFTHTWGWQSDELVDEGMGHSHASAGGTGRLPVHVLQHTHHRGTEGAHRARERPGAGPQQCGQVTCALAPLACSQVRGEPPARHAAAQDCAVRRCWRTEGQGKLSLHKEDTSSGSWRH